MLDLQILYVQCFNKEEVDYLSDILTYLLTTSQPKKNKKKKKTITFFL